MKAYKDQIKFIEPQSMNFEKKLSQAYLEFKEAMDKKKELQKIMEDKAEDEKDEPTKKSKKGAKD